MNDDYPLKISRMCKTVRTEHCYYDNYIIVQEVIKMQLMPSEKLPD